MLYKLKFANIKIQYIVILIFSKKLAKAYDLNVFFYYYILDEVLSWIRILSYSI